MQEPSLPLRLAMYHFAGGDGYVFGLLLYCAAQTLLLTRRFVRRRRSQQILARIGLIWSFVLPSPTPRWLLLLFGVSLIWTSFPARNKDSGQLAADDNSWRWINVALAFAIILFEVPYRFSPKIDGSSNRLCIVADSVTAGLNDGEDTWSQQLARCSTWQIVDASQPGATLKSAVEQVALLGNEPSVLLFEIGGNDLLEGVPVAQFTQDLERLFIKSRHPERIMIMFELPLPPLAFRYGEAQRKLAAKHGVALIPKQKLIGVIASTGGTVDGIHLAPLGHQRMAETVARILDPNEVKRGTSGTYRHVDPR